MGAGLGFVMGIAFTVISLTQFDNTETNAQDVALVSLLIGLPISVMLGLGIGWLWGRFMGPNSLS